MSKPRVKIGCISSIEEAIMANWTGTSWKHFSGQFKAREGE